MELRQFRYFVAVAEHANFTRASENLLVAQPALSAQIAKLEDEFGTRLLERTARGVRLTPTGALVLERARRVLAEADAAAAVARAGARGDAGRLVLAYSRGFPFLEVAGLIRAYRHERPAVELVLREIASSAQFDALRDGAIDVGLTRFDPGYDGDDQATAVEFTRTRIMAFFPAGHRLARKRSVRIGEFAGEPLVVPQRASGETFFDNAVAAVREAGFSPRIAQESPDTRILLALVAAGVGNAILTTPAADLRVRGVVAVPIVPARTMRWGIIARRDDVSGIVRAFVQEARALRVAEKLRGEPL